MLKSQGRIAIFSQLRIENASQVQGLDSRRKRQKKNSIYENAIPKPPHVCAGALAQRV
jgi:hypothetical protein